MSGEMLCVMLVPSAAGAAWREALAARATDLGWLVSDVATDPSITPGAGLVFADSHAAMLAFAPHARAVVIDTTLDDTVNFDLTVRQAAIVQRSHMLVEAEMAAKHGATVLLATRSRLEFPVLGPVERQQTERSPNGESALDSPLAVFDISTSAGRAHWHPRWFHYPEGHTGTIDRPLLDLTGRMRPVVYGPYIRLPEGRWRAELNVTVDTENSHVPLIFEWGAGVEFSRVVTTIRQAGTYAVSLEHVWEQPDAAQLRIWIQYPIFQGVLGFQGCEVNRVETTDRDQAAPH